MQLERRLEFFIAEQLALRHGPPSGHHVDRVLKGLQVPDRAPAGHDHIGAVGSRAWSCAASA